MWLDDGTAKIQVLLQQLADGNEFARDEIILVAAERLRKLTAVMLRGFPQLRRWEQTDDIFQTAVLKLHRSLQQVEPNSPQHFFNLAATQVRRTLIDLCRYHFGPAGAAAHHQSDAYVAEKASGAALQPESLAAWSSFHQNVERLPEDERAVFELIWYTGLGQEEVASCLQVSVPTVKRRWRRAKVRLHNGAAAIAEEARE